MPIVAVKKGNSFNIVGDFLCAQALFVFRQLDQFFCAAWLLLAGFLAGADADAHFFDQVGLVAFPRDKDPGNGASRFCGLWGPALSLASSATCALYSSHGHQRADHEEQHA